MKPVLESLEQRLAPSADPFAGLSGFQAVAPYVAQLEAFQQGFIAMQGQFDSLITQELALAQPLISVQSYMQLEASFQALQFLQTNWLQLAQNPAALQAYAQLTDTI